MYKRLQPVLQKELATIQEAGLFKKERIITTPQAADIKTADGKEVVNFCANNYLGLSSHPRVTEAAKRAIDTHGFGMSSVRFICGTQDIHKELEKKISEFLGTEDTILYAAAFDANGGVFEPLFGEKDAIISENVTLRTNGVSEYRCCVSKTSYLSSSICRSMESGPTITRRRVMLK